MFLKKIENKFGRLKNKLYICKFIQKVMKTYGVRKADNDCCIGHAKYGVKCLTASGKRKSRSSNKIRQDKARKAKMRQLKIEIEWN